MRKISNEKKVNLVISACILLICILFSSAQIFSIERATGDAAYEIKEYKFHAEVEKSHKYNVVTDISANLTDDLESLEFALPNGSFIIKDLKLNGKKINESNRIITVKNSEDLMQGEHNYKIEYSVNEYDDKKGKNNKYYFEVLPSSWLHPITRMQIDLAFPEDFPCEDVKYYAGQFGVQNVNTKLDYNVDEMHQTVSILGERIPENFGITLKANLPDNYWDGAINGNWALQLMLLIGAVITLIIVVLWFIGGQNPKFKKTLQAHPIEGLSPAEISYVANGRVRMRDVISLIVYFAIKGYLKISEYQPKKYRLIKVRDPKTKEEEKYLRTAYELLFEDIPKNRWIDVDDIGPRLRRIMKSLKEDVAAGFNDENMQSHTKRSKIFRTLSFILTEIVVLAVSLLKYFYVFASVDLVDVIASVVVSSVIFYALCKFFDSRDYSKDNNLNIKIITLSVIYFIAIAIIVMRAIFVTGAYLASIIAGVIILLASFFTLIMLARAKGNAELSGRIMQLREFIYHPDAKILFNAYMQDKNYYYDMMPYALVFKGLETWAISFVTLDVEEPDWYSDDIEGNAISNLNKGEKTVIDYAKDIKAFARAVGNTYHSMDRQGIIIWEINNE